MDAANASCLRVVNEQFYGPLSISGSPPNYTYSGPMVGLFDTMAKHLGYFCYKMEASPERVYGEPLPNGSWTGLMGMLQRREANVTGTLLSVTWLRTQVVDFSEYLDIDEFTALHSRPALTSDVTGLVRPFTYQTWLFLLLSLISAFAVTLIVVQRHQGLVAPREEQQRRHGKADWRINLKESWLWTWCGLLGQTNNL
ncbi:glutamate receptor ionotropic, kainate glr-3-like [Scylla paramamosain]|uniref:glutamate receptor ionotropic, kainate glr-3-like n=1 Tax=Scylla paramamosain TaxID=85552 RepID=UPI003082BE11